MANHVETKLTGQHGLWLSKSRHNFVVSGSSPDRGGTGEAWAAGELMLAALNGCAMSIVIDAAAKAGSALRDVVIAAQSERDKDHPNHYAFVQLDFTLHGVEQAEAERLVGEFQANCPIYGTVSRGAPVRVSIRALP